jgi:MFS family permease
LSIDQKEFKIKCPECGRDGDLLPDMNLSSECNFCGAILAPAPTNATVAEPNDSDNKSANSATKTFKVGTLVYTKAGLAWLFFWLLLGDFCFTMIETVTPSIVPLRLRQLDAPNWLIGVVMVTLPCILNSLLNPIISTVSDRHRGRWGRRIPFMLFTVPFVVTALTFMAFSTEIGVLLHRWVGESFGYSIALVTIGVVAFAMGMFKFSDMFVNTVFWYFFNDVVPQNVMARFLSLFRIIGASVGVLYNYFIFQYALSHLRIIFVSVAIIYLIGFALMCFMVKEGQYPPPEKIGSGSTNPFVMVKYYIKDCLKHRIYIYFFLHNTFWNLSGAWIVFNVFLKLSLGITLEQIGLIASAIGVANMLLNYPAGMLADRFHPLRIMLCIKICILSFAPVNLIWLFTSFDNQTNFIILIIIHAIYIPLGLIYTAVSLPMNMRILPKEKFGQFCSFNALCSAAMTAIGGVTAGAYIDLMRKYFPDDVWGKDFYYRFAPIWPLPFLIIGIFFLFMLYRNWKKLGGDEHYTPPN